MTDLGSTTNEPTTTASRRRRRRRRQQQSASEPAPPPSTYKPDDDGTTNNNRRSRTVYYVGLNDIPDEPGKFFLMDEPAFVNRIVFVQSQRSFIQNWMDQNDNRQLVADCERDGPHDPTLASSIRLVAFSHAHGIFAGLQTRPDDDGSRLLRAPRFGDFCGSIYIAGDNISNVRLFRTRLQYYHRGYVGGIDTDDYDDDDDYFPLSSVDPNTSIDQLPPTTDDFFQPSENGSYDPPAL